jgi:hypothetical protein
MSFPVGFPTIVSGQITMTGAAIQLPANNSSVVVLTNSAASAHSIFIGPSGVTETTGLEIPKGASVPLPISNTAALFAIGTADDVLSFAALL